MSNKIEKTQISVGLNDDYASVSMVLDSKPWEEVEEALQFYFGYEEQPNEEDGEWGFVVYKDDEKIFSLSEKQLEELAPDIKDHNPERYLLVGMYHYIQQQEQDNNDRIRENDESHRQARVFGLP